MKVVYYSGDEIIYKTKTKDLNGLMAAVEKSELLRFDQDVYHLDRFQLNHYKTEKDYWKEALHIYLKKQKS